MEGNLYSWRRVKWQCPEYTREHEHCRSLKSLRFAMRAHAYDLYGALQCCRSLTWFFPADRATSILPSIEGGVASRRILQIVRISSNGLGSNFHKFAKVSPEDAGGLKELLRLKGALRVGALANARIANVKDRLASRRFWRSWLRSRSASHGWAGGRPLSDTASRVCLGSRWASQHGKDVRRRPLRI